MNNTPLYPRDEFLRDFEDWQASKIPNGQLRAVELFVRRYPDEKIFAYRYNRFAAIIGNIASNLSQLTQDKIVIFGEQGSQHVPQELLLALLEWYCGVDDNTMKTMPKPDWVAVMKIYDGLKSRN